MCREGTLFPEGEGSACRFAVPQLHPHLKPDCCHPRESRRLVARLVSCRICHVYRMCFIDDVDGCLQVVCGASSFLVGCRKPGPLEIRTWVGNTLGPYQHKVCSSAQHLNPTAPGQRNPYISNVLVEATSRPTDCARVFSAWRGSISSRQTRRCVRCDLESSHLHAIYTCKQGARLVDQRHLHTAQ